MALGEVNVRNGEGQRGLAEVFGNGDNKNKRKKENQSSANKRISQQQKGSAQKVGGGLARFGSVCLIRQRGGGKP